MSLLMLCVLLPVILGLQELKFVFNPVARLCNRKFEAGLAGLMRRLKEGC